MIKAWFAFEVLGTSKEITEKSLKTHIDKFAGLPQVEEIERSVSEVEETTFKGKTAYSSVAEITANIKSFYDLLNIIMVYGPSSVEILEPEKLELSMEEMQNISNVVAGLVHQFAAAGVGGLVINQG
jgi:hypothetical protein